MEVNISELRFGEVEAALALANAAGAALRAEQVRHELSLKARCGEDMVAAALCVYLGEGDYELHVLFAADRLEHATARTLLDKALLKLAAVRLQKCRIIAPQLNDKPDFWAATQWHQPDADADTDTREAA